jgi:hypothetical protein
MSARHAVVGQRVYINGGFGPVAGRVVKVEPLCVYVETSNGQLRFNKDGKECGLDGKAYDYENNVMFGPGPWELRLEEKS